MSYSEVNQVSHISKFMLKLMQSESSDFSVLMKYDLLKKCVTDTTVKYLEKRPEFFLLLKTNHS